MLSKIYIIHYTKNQERWRHMTMEMSKWFPHIEYEFIEKYDREELTDDIILQNFDTKAYQGKFNRPFSKPEMSLSMKFKECFSRISQDIGDYFLVLEDDVIFKQDPVSYINQVIEYCDRNSVSFDCVFMGEAELRHKDDRDIFYKKEYRSTNGLCTVLYKKQSILKLHDNLSKHPIVTQAFDWELNDRFRDLEFNVYWAKAITKHGSVVASREGAYQGLRSMLR